MEQLVSSAIKCRPLDSEYFTVFCGKRHGDIFQWMFAHQINYDKHSAKQGFVTDSGRFVDRYEAKEIAVSADQLIVPGEETYAELFSEDVW